MDQSRVLHRLLYLWSTRKTATSYILKSVHIKTLPTTEKGRNVNMFSDKRLFQCLKMNETKGNNHTHTKEGEMLWLLENYLK